MVPQSGSAWFSSLYANETRSIGTNAMRVTIGDFTPMRTTTNPRVAARL